MTLMNIFMLLKLKKIQIKKENLILKEYLIITKIIIQNTINSLKNQRLRILETLKNNYVVINKIGIMNIGKKSINRVFKDAKYYLRAIKNFKLSINNFNEKK